MVDDVLDGDFKVDASKVFRLWPFPVNPPLMLLQVCFLSKVVGADAALERSVLVASGGLVGLESRLVGEDSQASGTLEGVGRGSGRW